MDVAIFVINTKGKCGSRWFLGKTKTSQEQGVHGIGNMEYSITRLIEQNEI